MRLTEAGGLLLEHSKKFLVAVPTVYADAMPKVIGSSKSLRSKVKPRATAQIDKSHRSVKYLQSFTGSATKLGAVPA